MGNREAHTSCMSVIMRLGRSEGGETWASKFGSLRRTVTVCASCTPGTAVFLILLTLAVSWRPRGGASVPEKRRRNEAWLELAGGGRGESSAREASRACHKMRFVDEAGADKAVRTNGWLLNGYLCPRALKQTMHARGNYRKGYESQPQLSCAVGRRTNRKEQLHPIRVRCRHVPGKRPPLRCHCWKAVPLNQFNRAGMFRLTEDTCWELELPGRGPGDFLSFWIDFAARQARAIAFASSRW